MSAESEMPLIFGIKHNEKEQDKNCQIGQNLSSGNRKNSVAFILLTNIKSMKEVEKAVKIPPRILCFYIPGQSIKYSIFFPNIM